MIDRVSVAITSTTLFAIFTLASVCSAQQSNLLLHWTFDRISENQTSAKDQSSNQIDATIDASIVDSPSGQAVFMDGTSDK
ncbi:MAG TPA: hypothetical protein PLY87_30360, partial [Planctomycetaceae bacterium]|nr:hypothetical protein [Planctomycetaceae bacterium]